MGWGGVLGPDLKVNLLSHRFTLGHRWYLPSWYNCVVKFRNSFVEAKLNTGVCGFSIVLYKEKQTLFIISAVLQCCFEFFTKYFKCCNCQAVKHMEILVPQPGIGTEKLISKKA